MGYLIQGEIIQNALLNIAHGYSNQMFFNRSGLA